MDNATVADIDPNLDHRLLKGVTLFRLFDHVDSGTKHFDAEFFEYSMLNQVHGRIQPGLTSKGRQQGVGTFDLNDFGDVLPRDRFNICPIRHFRIGHDRRGIRVHEDDLVTLFAKSFTRLSTGIIEFTGLADDNRARTNNQNLTNVVATGHGG